MDGCSYYRRRVTTRPVLPYDDRGEGPALFFVHGFLNDASVWTAVIDELETDFRCIAVDLPGHGRSPGNGAGTYGRDLVLGDLRAVMDETECGPVVMVGHSLGGYLSLAMAIEDPHRVTGLGLVGAGPGFRNPDYARAVERFCADVGSRTRLTRGDGSDLDACRRHGDGSDV